MNDIVLSLKNRVKFHEEQLRYMTTTTKEMYMREGAIKELIRLIKYFEQHYNSVALVKVKELEE